MNLFSYIKTKVSIIDVVNEYTTLKRAGLYWKAHCPFHHEKSASFTVSPHKEIFYCFGCHITGDAISFISRMENCTPLEAVKHLAERFNIELPSELVMQESDTMTKKRDSYFELCHSVAQWAHEQLINNPTVLNYLKERGISSHCINLFMLGYFPGGMRSIKLFLQAMNQQNFVAADLLEAHILLEGTHMMYSPFEERIIFPIKDHLGRFCGFGGRIYKTEDTRPKYYNSREGTYFTKGSLLFGLDTAKRKIQETETVFFVEGYTDCIAMVQHGYPNTVATLGTACTIEHLKQISRYAKTVYVMYDGDMAGQQAMLRMTELCWQCSLDLFTISLPSNYDPASFLVSGSSLAPYVAKAQDIFSHFVASLGAHFSSKPLQEKMRLTERIIEMLAHVDNPLKQDFLIQQAAQALCIPTDSLKREIACRNKNNTIADRTVSQDIPPEKTDTCSEPTKLEKRIFFAIMNNIQLVNGSREEYLVKYFSEPLRTLLIRLKQERAARPELDFTRFFDMLDNESQKIVSQIMMTEGESVSADMFDQLIQQFLKRHWKMLAHDITLQLEQAKKSSNVERVQTLIQEFLELKKRVLEKNIL